MRIALFEFASATARFPTRTSATPGQVPRLVQHQTSGHRTRARGWTLSGGRAADCELRLLDHEVANFVMWISRPRSPVMSGNANNAFPKGLFLRESFIFCNESPTNENERFVNAFHRPSLLLLCGLSFVRGNYKRGEQRAHQNGKGERREVEKKTCAFLRPFLKRKEERVKGPESPSSFEGPGTSCGARVRIVLPCPSAAMSIRRISLSGSMHTPPTSKYSHQVAILCPLKYMKMHIIASDFSKISRGSMPPDPPSRARASPKLMPSVRKLTGA